MTQGTLPRILGIGIATPRGSINQQAAGEMVCDLSGLHAEARQRAIILHRRSGITARGSVLADTINAAALPFYTDHPPGPGQPTTSQRMSAFQTHASGLAKLAAQRALLESNIPATSIGHLITASCTGFASPGVDIDLIEQLELPRSSPRTHIGFMGCHAAINSLRLASALTTADPSLRTLMVCTELCSLHFDASGRPDAMVANALFADGAAACVLAGASVKPTKPVPNLRVLATGSFIIPGTRDAMTWRIGDRGFEMTLSPALPGIVSALLRPWLQEFLSRSDLQISDIRGWAVHPGGPKILEAVEHSLSLSADALNASRSILQNHGNMSSPTVLFILDRLMRTGPCTPALLLAFGPGISIEAALVGHSD